MKVGVDFNSNIYYQEGINGTFKRVSSLRSPIESYGSLSACIRGCLALLLRAGYVLIQLGSIPVENVYVILLQNIADIAVSLASFGLVGYILAFGQDILHGFIGYGVWINSESIDLDIAIFGFSGCLIANGIITTILAGRIHFIGCLLTCLLFSMVLQPIIMHWVWHDVGWMHRRILLDRQVSVKDHAGGLTVHTTAGIVGFLGALFLGRRLLKLSEIHESSIGSESPGSTLTGYTFVVLGLIAFSLPTVSYEFIHEPQNYIGIVLINNIMAMAGGIIVVIVLHFLFHRETFNYWIILRCIQGAIAGIVMISAGVDIYTPMVAYGISCMAGVVFYFVTICVHNSSLEDYCNVTALHLVCGILGTILPPLLGVTENLGFAVSHHTRLVHLGWQVICLLTILVTLIAIFIVFFFFLNVSGFLRNKTEEISHRRGMIVSGHVPGRCCFQRLFALEPTTTYIEPGFAGKNPKYYAIFPDKEEDVNQLNTFPRIEKKPTKSSLKKPSNFSQVGSASSKKEIYGRDEELIYTTQNVAVPRFVFTMPIEETMQNTQFTAVNCIGDSERNCKPQNVTNTELRVIEDCNIEQDVEERAGIFDSRISSHELHRTKKYTNLLRNKSFLRTKRCKSSNDMDIMDITQSSLCMMYDKQFSDGFITIKMPQNRNYANLSDESDSLN